MIRLGLVTAFVWAMTAPLHADPMPEAVQSFGDTQTTNRLLVQGTTDIALFAPAIEGFLASNGGLGIDYEQWSSNDLYAAAQAACHGEGVSADLIVSSAIDQQLKLANDGCALPHRSAQTAALPAASNWRDEVFGTTREPAVIVYNRAFLSEAEAPRSRFDLVDLLRPEGNRFQNRIATYDIELSGLGYLFAFADAQEATTFGGLIEAFGRSGAVHSCCSSTLVDGVASGEFLIAYNVLGSYALDRAAENPDIVVVAPDDYTLVLSRAASIPKGARQPAVAGAFIDYLLSEEGRAVLRASRLIVDTGPGAEAALRLPENPETSLRPIPLTPALMVGLDQHKRREFIARWRDSLAPAGE